ncbi:unnamed protein product [Rhizoctonia solani]|uniref:HMG box domain-containing protein n=1 Tax=Rhizoctonia solani TaxID=456999 RepID=A0A8H3B327_9AGAM|nr:unnamed protein product [Rhizoctonia solani]
MVHQSLRLAPACIDSFHLFPDTSISLSALQNASGSYHNEPAYTTSNDTFSRDSPRFPTEGEAPNHQLYYPSNDSLLSSGGSALQARASPELNDTPTSPHEDLDSIQTGAVGPIRVAKSHSRRQPPGHIPRPRNAFILYRSWYVRQGFLSDVENDHREISRIVGKIWKQMSPEEQAPWRAMAEEEKAEHARMYPNYKYSPNSRRDAAAAASPTRRNAPTRPSAARSRKTKPCETSVKKRSDAIAGAFVSGSRKLSLTVGTRKIDEQIKADEESEAVVQIQALTLAYPTSPSDRSSVEPERPSSPVHCGASPTVLVSASNDRAVGLDVPGTLPDLTYEPTGDFSLAACSMLPGEFNPDSVQLLPPDEYYRSETFFNTALRSYYDVDAGLGTSLTCDDMTDFSSFKFPTDSNLYPESSYTNATPNHLRVASEPELSPFDRIALEGTPAGHPGATSFDTPVWDGLFASSSSPSNATSSLSSDSFSNFSWSQSRDYSGAEKYSASSVSGDDHGLFSEWCNPDSPVATDSSDVGVLTPTSISSGAPSPPLTLAYPSPTYPQKHSALLYHSWETSYEDIDAYERALGDIKAEIDDHRIF